MEFQLFKKLEHSAYLMLDIINRVIAEHKYPFRTYVTKHKIIEKVASLVKVKSSLLNIEIIKFYKGILRSKDVVYIQYIV